ncbi:prolipoprotein diacylglyceryl transferase [Dongia soli]|uniref:Phosphatidylglycerol--prolipoprotein diacylglyceryl transferase n=1 Tax=Dongia soli TaxID=600628 RepID=A0ABU5EC71_9PROT|nr:prolipoprotein diacylglyceryl transferase [Dongia soli]MDY0883889.1 prolipoprotein diacylglyceryl transferase [Dongia soli]
MAADPSGYFVFPDFNPVALSLGPLDIRWYALSYIAGILLGWWYCVKLISLPPRRVKREQFDDLVTWIVVGIILGGRLGQVLLWAPGYYFRHPLEIVMIWKGGMAFHGGLIGVILAMYFYGRRQKLGFFTLSDIVACGTPIGLCLGRIANFINGELWGRITDVPWAVIFPNAGPEPRHPSQLYEALLEGVLLFLLMHVSSRKQWIRERTGTLSGIFLIGYAIARSISEIFREPEVNLGANAATTWGQILCIPMILFGLYLVLHRRQKAAA